MRSSSLDQWLYVAAPLFAYGIVILGLAAWGWGEGGGGNLVSTFFRSISFTLHRLTGLPGWAMAGALTGLTAAGIAAAVAILFATLEGEDEAGRTRLAEQFGRVDTR